MTTEQTARQITDAERQRMREIGTFDNASAKAFAEETGLTVYQVRAVAVRDDDITYVAKAKTSVNGGKVETKADIVAEIAESLGLEASQLESLENATKFAIGKVRDALAS